MMIAFPCFTAATMPEPAYFIITGSTGRQGGATIDALLNDRSSPIQPSKIYAIARDISSVGSIGLARKGVQLMQGDLSNATAIFANIRGQGVDLSKSGAYLVQAHGPNELQHAKQFISAAASYGVSYLVYSSVDRGGREASDRDASYCKTFSDKYLIEKHLISVANSSSSHSQNVAHALNYTILRPTWFADNAVWGFPGRLCMTGWRDRLQGKRMQITCVRDIGRWAAEALLRPDRAGLRNQSVSVASETLSYAEADKVFREETGHGIALTNAWLTWVVVWLVKDLRTMFGWIDERDYGADLEWLGRWIEPTSFRAWVKANASAAKEI